MGALAGNPVADMQTSEAMPLHKILHSIEFILCRWDFLWKILEFPVMEDPKVYGYSVKFLFTW